MSDVAIHFVELGDGRLAASDGHATIWLDPRQRQAQRRCSLAHELEHLARGHRGCQPPAVERRVEEAAARQLIALDDLARALAWSQHAGEVAEELVVDVDMLNARLRSLSGSETQSIQVLLRSIGGAA